MKTNMGTWDRIIRFAIAIVLLFMVYAGRTSGAWTWVAGIVGVVFALASLVGICPPYLLFGISTRPRQ